jgi:hypothetical protein
MKNREIIQYIDRYCAHDEELNCIFDADLAYTILAHEYLYVKPGIDTEYFLRDVYSALVDGTMEGISMFEAEIVGCCPLDECIRICMAERLLWVAQESFNNEYFEHQIKHLDPDEECDGNLLDKYLNLMNKEQLCDFFYNVCRYSVCYSVFSGGDIAFEIEDELHKCCREMDPALPKERYDSKRNVSYRKEHPYYIADYLSHDEIADAIKRVIVNNKTLAGHVARQFYYTNDFDSLYLYITLISTYERVFRKDLYKPEIRTWEYSDDSDDSDECLSFTASD